MKLGEDLANGAAMLDRRPVDANAFQKGNNCSGTIGKLPQRLARPVTHRLGAIQTVLREMLHQGDEERKILGFNAFLIEGENEGAAFGAEQEVRVLDALRNPLHRQDAANVIETDKGGELFVRNFRIHRHALLRCSTAQIARQGKKHTLVGCRNGFDFHRPAFGEGIDHLFDKYFGGRRTGGDRQRPYPFEH